LRAVRKISSAESFVLVVLAVAVVLDLAMLCCNVLLCNHNYTKLDNSTLPLSGF
jgi:hypothetical protein